MREISINYLNSELAAASCAECNVTLDIFHHDVEPLPNGHWLALATQQWCCPAPGTSSDQCSSDNCARRRDRGSGSESATGMGVE